MRTRLSYSLLQKQNKKAPLRSESNIREWIRYLLFETRRNLVAANWGEVERGNEFCSPILPFQYRYWLKIEIQNRLRSTVYDRKYISNVREIGTRFTREYATLYTI